MEKLSVFVKGVSNSKKFLNSLFTEIGNEISAEINEYEVLFYNIDEEKTKKLYDILAKNVLNEFCKKALIKIVNKNCDYFSKDDKYEIWRNSMSHILNDEFENNGDYAYRLQIVKKQLEDFLANSEKFSVEGFVNFRLKELEYNLEEIVEESVQDYLLEREYKDFINMLKYFVSIQNYKYLAVDVVYDDEILIFGDGKNITEECREEFNREVLSKEANKEDFLLNSLISIAPKRINIKDCKNLLNDEIKKTLQGIFGNKLKINLQ